jgi:hypothetical protein
VKWLFLLLTTGGAVAVVFGATVFALREAPPVGPLARFPATVELGERRPGEVAVAEFPITNAGDRPLVLTDIRTSCSCAGLETDQDGRRVRVTEVTIPPGSTAPLSFQVSVAVSPGRPQTVLIGFRTNDPASPSVSVPARVSRVVGVPFARPSAVHFGTVRVGQHRSEVVTVLPNATPGVRVVRATSSHPDRVSVATESLPAGDPAEPGGRSVAQLRIALLTDQPGDLDAFVSVELAGDGVTSRELRVPVGGRVRQPVECLPGRVLLGKTASTVYLVGTDVTPFTVTVVATPPGLAAVVEPEPSLSGRAQARLILTPAAALFPAGMVRLSVVTGNGPPFELEVPVSCPVP